MPISTELALETKRCILRQPRTSDAPRLLSAFTSKEFPDYVPLGRIDSLEQVRDWIEDGRERWASGTGYTFTAIRKSDQLVIGQVSLVKIEVGETWSLAFWTHPDCWGKGFATEIAGAAIYLAFDQLSAVRIWAAAATWNTASLKVLLVTWYDRVCHSPNNSLQLTWLAAGNAQIACLPGRATTKLPMLEPPGS